MLRGTGAEIRSAITPDPLCNLKIAIEEEAFSDGDIYAKVLSTSPQSGGDFVLRFTSLPEKAAAALAAR